MGPNPFNDKIQFNITEDFPNIQVSILDVTGKVLFQSNHNEQLVEVYGSKLSKGVYIVKVSKGKHIVTRKLVKD